jgi:hypothetical protein
MNQTPLKRWRHVKLWFLQRHPEAFARLRPLLSELEQKKDTLQRNQPAPVSPRRVAESFARPSVVGHHGF